MAMRAMQGLALGVAVALAGCASAPTAEVTRFHLGQPIPSDTIAVVPSPDAVTPGAAVPLEFTTYARAVGAELAKAGFRPVEGPSAYVAVLKIEQSATQGPPRSAPFQIGIGGGTGGRSGGVGGSISLPVGKAPSSVVRTTSLSLRIRRQSDATAVWEGRASQTTPADAAGASLTAAVPRLAAALLAGFPGKSGSVETVKLPK